MGLALTAARVAGWPAASWSSRQLVEHRGRPSAAVGGGTLAAASGVAGDWPAAGESGACEDQLPHASNSAALAPVPGINSQPGTRQGLQQQKGQELEYQKPPIQLWVLALLQEAAASAGRF